MIYNYKFKINKYDLQYYDLKIANSWAQLKITTQEYKSGILFYFSYLIIFTFIQGLQLVYSIKNKQLSLKFKLNKKIKYEEKLLIIK